MYPWIDAAERRSDPHIDGAVLTYHEMYTAHQRRAKGLHGQVLREHWANLPQHVPSPWAESDWGQRVLRERRIDPCLQGAAHIQ